MANELLTRPYETGFSRPVELDTHFYMNEIEVDGITSKRPINSLNSNLLFSLKMEDDAVGDPSDTGRPMHWMPDLEISEYHWLKCGMETAKHGLCLVCGERLLDE